MRIKFAQDQDPLQDLLALRARGEVALPQAPESGQRTPSVAFLLRLVDGLRVRFRRPAWLDEKTP